MPDERQWVEELAPRLEQSLAELCQSGKVPRVNAHKNLCYTYELFPYG